MIELTVNGAPTTLAEPTTVDALVAAHCESPKGVAVARNEEVVPRSRWADTAVAAGDRIEILTAAQGG